MTPDGYWVDRAAVAEGQVSVLREQVAHLASEVRDLTCRLLRQPEPRTSGLDREFKEHLRALIQYCHPDKHGGSQGATQVTQWLNDVKRRLPCG